MNECWNEAQPTEQVEFDINNRERIDILKWIAYDYVYNNAYINIHI